MKTASFIAIISVVILLAIAAVLIFDIGRKAPESYLSISSYDACAAAGYPILETYPPQCKTPDGRTFTQSVAATATPTPTSGATSTPGPSTTATPGTGVTLTNIKSNALIASPVKIQGSAPGGWFFEAQLGLEVVDANNISLGVAPAHAIGDWMTSAQVSFEGTVSFTTPGTKTGFILVHKDNPSGLPENDQTVKFPVTFSK